VTARLQRVALVAGMALATTSIWTGAPLAGLWVGSRVAPSSGISMPAVFAVAVTIFAVAFGLIRILAALGARYDGIVGRAPSVRQHVPWLRSMRGERPHGVPGGDASLSAVDYVLVAGVVLCWLAFEYWFFFKSGSSIDQRSGR
jgi:hypothetical protein